MLERKVSSDRHSCMVSHVCPCTQSVRSLQEMLGRAGKMVQWAKELVLHGGRKKLTSASCPLTSIHVPSMFMSVGGEV